MKPPERKRYVLGPLQKSQKPPQPHIYLYADEDDLALVESLACVNGMTRTGTAQAWVWLDPRYDPQDAWTGYGENWTMPPLNWMTFGLRVSSRP